MLRTAQKLRLAERMSRLGTESAFEVLVRAQLPSPHEEGGRRRLLDDAAAVRDAVETTAHVRQ